MKYNDIYDPNFLKQFAWMKDSVGGMELPNDSFAIDVEDILKRCGLHTEPSVEPHVQGGIDGHVVYINPLNKLNEIRFREAHGLGHYLFGHIGPAGQYRDDNEKEANAFAANLLAPKKLIMMFLRIYVRENGITSLKNDAAPLIYAASRAMEVPEHVMRDRMKETGIITVKSAGRQTKNNDSGAIAPDEKTEEKISEDTPLQATPV